ncbi:MAG: hypothetical protein K2Z81_09570 [Cyanobacteria bacterium]|nr:hypothetical protein [Cyanobacteriota bacterium]
MVDSRRLTTVLAVSLGLICMPDGTAQTTDDTEPRKSSGQKIIVPADCIDTGKKAGQPKSKKAPTGSEKTFHLNVQLEGRTGRFSDRSFTFYRPEEIAGKEYGKFSNDPAVMARIQSWRQWYGSIYKIVEGKVGTKVPKTFCAKLVVTITPDKPVIVVTEWMNTSTETDEKFGKSLVEAFKNLPADSLNFPDADYNKSIEIWFFADDSNGFSLSNLDHPITVNGDVK